MFVSSKPISICIIITDMVTNRNVYILTFLILLPKDVLYYYGNEYEYVIR